MLNRYEQVAAINVNEHIEKKGQLSYLSWAWAVDQLLRLDPDANWTYEEPITCDDGTMLVRCTVTAFGKARAMQLPVMDYKNRAIANPDAFAVNTAMQRCLVKAIALHGLGLYIYAGEDLPPSEQTSALDAEVGKDGEKIEPTARDRKDSARQVTVDAFEALSAETKDLLRTHASVISDMHKARGPIVAYLAEQDFDDEMKLGLWSLLPSNVRAWIKDQEKIARMNGIGQVMKATELASQG